MLGETLYFAVGAYLLGAVPFGKNHCPTGGTN